MKRPGWWIVLLGVVMLAACGAPEAVIGDTAARLNLADLGLEAPFQMSERSKDEIVALLGLTEVGALTDASLRTFVPSTEAVSNTPALSGTTVMAAVLVYNSSGEASKGLDNAREGMKEALRVNEPAIVVQELNAQAEGQPSYAQAYFGQAEVPGRAPRVYMFLIRKQNVVGMITTSGLPEAFNEQQLRALAARMHGKWPEPAAPLKSP